MPLPLTLAVIAALAAGQAGRAPAASPTLDPRQPPPAFRVSTELVQFDVLVLDEGGRAVPTLTTADFEVRQDGVPVILRHAVFVDRRAWQASDGAESADAPRIGIDIEPLVFLIDDMAMTPDGFSRVRTALRQFVQQGVPAGVEVGILRTGQPGWRTTTLTADPAVLVAGIDRLEYLARSYRAGYASASGASGAGTRELERTFVEGTLGSLNSLVANLRRLPGRKTVVLLSEGVALDLSCVAVAEPVEAKLNRLAQLAAEAGVTTHTIDVKGVTTGSGTLFLMLGEGLVTLAAKMSGVHVIAGNDLLTAVNRVRTAEAGYYLLSYEPPPGTFVAGGSPPFRRLSVRVHRPGLTARTRAGFFGRR